MLGMDTQKEKAKLDYEDIVGMCVNFVVWMLYIGGAMIVAMFAFMFINMFVAEILFFTLLGTMVLTALVFFGYSLIVEMIMVLYRFFTGKKINGR